jgi:hypothetical protein
MTPQGICNIVLHKEYKDWSVILFMIIVSTVVGVSLDDRLRSLTSNYCPLSPLVKIPPGTSNSFI